MAKIDVAVDQLRANSSSMQAKIQELQQLNQNLDTLLLKVEDSWDGEASNAYIALMRGYSAKAKVLEQVFTEFKRYIDEAANRFETVDVDSASKIRNSF